MLAFMVVYALSYGAMFAAATDAVAGREISMRRSWGLMAARASSGPWSCSASR
jgi:hypothetical protein